MPVPVFSLPKVARAALPLAMAALLNACGGGLVGGAAVSEPVVSESGADAGTSIVSVSASAGAGMDAGTGIGTGASAAAS